MQVRGNPLEKQLHAEGLKPVKAVRKENKMIKQEIRKPKVQKDISQSGLNWQVLLNFLD